MVHVSEVVIGLSRRDNCHALSIFEVCNSGRSVLRTIDLLILAGCLRVKLVELVDLIVSASVISRKEWMSKFRSFARLSGG